MKTHIPAFAFALASSLVAVTAFAQTPAPAPGAGAGAEALLKKHACIACHQTAVRTVGPSYKEVAAKYKGQKGAEQMLFDKVKKGGAGNWGTLAMPPQDKVPDADLRVMIKWILAVK